MSFAHTYSTPLYNLNIHLAIFSLSRVFNGLVVLLQVSNEKFPLPSLTFGAKIWQKSNHFDCFLPFPSLLSDSHISYNSPSQPLYLQRAKHDTRFILLFFVTRYFCDNKRAKLNGFVFVQLIRHVMSSQLIDDARKIFFFIETVHCF